MPFRQFARRNAFTVIFVAAVFLNLCFSLYTYHVQDRHACQARQESREALRGVLFKILDQFPGESPQVASIRVLIEHDYPSVNC